MNLFNKIIASVLFLLCCQIGFGQLSLDQTITPESAAQLLVGSGVTISNVNVSAADSSWAYFYNSNTELSSAEGLLLTTGKARNAMVQDGINGTGLPEIENQTTCLNCDEFDNNFPGSALLNTVNDRTTFDATTFEFDVKVQGDSLSFDFTFASEEYEEWVGSSFNDVFGFFISGPGGFNDVNIALIPETILPVSINNVNNIFNSEYYYDNRNPLGQNIQYDGFTLGLKAEVGDLTPCETYTLKLIIADGTDRLYDSAVFIEKINSNYSDIVTSTSGGTPYMVEGCNDGEITFVAEQISNIDQEIAYSFGGTATIFDDYTTTPSLGNNIPLDEQSITIPANELSASIQVNTIDDSITEGDEFITLYILNTVCDTYIQDSVIFIITDSLELSVIPTNLEICPGDEVTLQGISDTNGDFTFSWEPEEEVTSPNAIVTTASPLQDTDYTITSNLAACQAEATTSISVKYIGLSATITPINCSGAAIGSIDLTVSNFSEPLSFSWTNNTNTEISTDEDVSDLLAGVYSVTVTDGDGCEATQSFVINEENTLQSNLLLSDYNGSTISCNGQCDGTALVSPTGGSGDYTITWSESVPENTTSLSDLCPGTYSVTIADSEGCEIAETFIISEPELLEGSVLGVTEILCSGTSSGEASVSATGGTIPYAYSWSNDPSGLPVLGLGPVLSNLGDGTYFVTVSDGNGCIAENSVEVIVAPPPPPISIALSALTYGNGFNTTCFDSTDGELTADITGGVSEYDLQWFDDTNNPIGSDLTITGLDCGSYTLNVLDQNGCTETASIQVTCPTQITADLLVTPNSCSDLLSEGAIDITPSGGSGVGYTFSWQDQDGVDYGVNEDLVNLPSGTYTVTITDSDGCSRTISTQVTNEESVTISVSDLDNNSCFESCDGSIAIDVTGAPGEYTVEWSTLDGVYSADEDLTGLCPDTYFVVVTSEDGCQASQQFIITQPTEIIIELISTLDPGCQGQNSGEIDIAVSGGGGPLTTEWEPLGEFGGSTDEDIESLEDGIYTVNVTDQSNMCVATLEVELEAPQAFELDIQFSVYDGGFFTSCIDASDGTYNVAASGANPDFENLEFGYFYDWSNLPLGNDPSAPNQANLMGGVTYGLVVTDTAGCEISTILNPISPDTLLAMETLFTVSCTGLNDGGIVPNITGGSGNITSYDWTGDIGDNEVDADTLFNLSPGTYTLEVFDTNGCTFIESFEVTEPSPLESELVSITQEDCFGSSNASLEVSASGGTADYSFDWIDDSMNTYSGAILTDIPSGEYYLTVIDDNGCIALDTIDVSSDEIFALDLTLFQTGTGDFTLACLGDENGSVLADVTGGIPDYTYVWTDDQNTVIGSESILSDLAAGTYNVDISDLSGCLLNGTVTVTEPLSSFTANAALTSPIQCNGECTAIIDITATGGDSDYSYLWELNEEELDFGPTADELCAGAYEVIVIDANGCDTLMNISVTEPLPIVVNSNITAYLGNPINNVSCFNSEDGQLDVEITGGVSPYDLNWNGSIGDNDATNDTLFTIGAGVYNLVFTDQALCTTEVIFNLTEPDSLEINEIITPIDCFDNDNGVIDANPNGGSGTYTFAWGHTPDNTAVVSSLAGTTYEVTVTDENGCATFEQFQMIEPPLLSVSATTTPSSCGLDNGAISTSSTGGTIPYTYSWSNDASPVPNPDNLAGNTYTLTLTDDNSCETELDVLVASSVGIEVALITVTDVLCFNEDTGCIELEIETSNGNVESIYTNEFGEISNSCDIPTGEYTVILTDEENCQYTQTFTISQPEGIEILLESPITNSGYNVSVYQGADGVIQTDVEGGVTPYDFSWIGPNNYINNEQNLNSLIAGTYTLLLTDDNGCISTDLITVTEPQPLTLPNGLTPNADGRNDNYVILGVDQFDKVELLVYNRWGNVVYSNSNYTNNWSGLNDNGEELSDGTYYVIATAVSNNENTELNSFLDLRR